jgi:hypothetical protein
MLHIIFVVSVMEKILLRSQSRTARWQDVSTHLLPILSLTARSQEMSKLSSAHARMNLLQSRSLTLAAGDRM